MMRTFVFVMTALSVATVECFSLRDTFRSRSPLTVRNALDTAQPLPYDTAPLKACLEREYTGFFSPMELQFYEDDVLFQDPLTSLTGVLSYKANVDLLAGRNLLGKILFRDASIALHSVKDTGPGKVRTRWTLQLTMVAIPWAPTAYFSGVSDYDIDESTGKVRGQQDYWDSINLVNGEYEKKPKLVGVSDFVSQLSPWNPERVTQPPAGPPTTLAAATSALGVASSAAVAGVVAAVSQGLKHRDSELAAILAEAASAAKEAAAIDVEEKKVRSTAQEAALISRLPYELLRRGNEYDVRRYPSAIFAASAATASDDAKSNNGDSNSEFPSNGALDKVQKYLGGSNADNAQVVPFTPSLWSWADKAEGVENPAEILCVPVALQNGQDIAAAAAAAAAACPTPLEGESTISVAPFFDDARGNVYNGPLDCGVVVAVRKLSKPKSKSSKDDAAAGSQHSNKLKGADFVAVHTALLEALKADGLKPANADTSNSLLRATYRQIMTEGDEVKRDVDVPEDEAWVLLSSHDWN